MKYYAQVSIIILIDVGLSITFSEREAGGNQMWVSNNTWKQQKIHELVWSKTEEWSNSLAVVRVSKASDNGDAIWKRLFGESLVKSNKSDQKARKLEIKEKVGGTEIPLLEGEIKRGYKSGPEALFLTSVLHKESWT